MVKYVDAVWKTKTVKTWAEYVRFVEGFDVGSPVVPAYIYRGQSKEEWTLSPTLARIFRPDEGADQGDGEVERRTRLARAVEMHSERIFRNQAPLLFEGKQVPAKEDFLEWAVLMRHYGAPTRILDWTASPFVALYFAVLGNWDSNGAVWVLWHSTLVAPKEIDTLGTFTEELDFDPDQIGEPIRLVAFESTTGLQRVAAQQSRFTACTHPLQDHAGALIQAMGTLSPPADEAMKIVIPAAAKLPMLRKLRAANITGAALFPGLDGLGSSVDELVRIAAHAGDVP